MPTQRENFRFSKKDEREKYTTVLKECIKNHLKQDGKTDIEQLKNTLKTVIETIDSSLENNQFRNKMQLTALMTLEAEFFKAIVDIENISQEQKKAYKQLYKELYGKESKYQKKLNEFKEKLGEKVSLIDISKISDRKCNDIFDTKLAFTKQMQILFNSKGEITLPTADDNTAISFLMHIDSQILSYAIACNNGSPLDVNIEKNRAKDILHEAVITSKALCCTVVKTSVVLFPPLLMLGLTTATPVTIGIALCVLSLELAYLNQKDQLEYVQTNKIKNQVTDRTTEAMNQEQQKDEKGIKISDIFNIPKLLEGIVFYMSNTYKKHKLSFTEQVPEDSLDSIFKSHYKKHKIRGNIEEIDKSTIQMFKAHCAEVGIIKQLEA